MTDSWVFATLWQALQISFLILQNLVTMSVRDEKLWLTYGPYSMESTQVLVASTIRRKPPLRSSTLFVKLKVQTFMPMMPCRMSLLTTSCYQNHSSSHLKIKTPMWHGTSFFNWIHKTNLKISVSDYQGKKNSRSKTRPYWRHLIFYNWDHISEFINVYVKGQRAIQTCLRWLKAKSNCSIAPEHWLFYTGYLNNWLFSSSTFAGTLIIC